MDNAGTEHHQSTTRESSKRQSQTVEPLLQGLEIKMVGSSRFEDHEHSKRQPARSTTSNRPLVNTRRRTYTVGMDKNWNQEFITLGELNDSAEKFHKIAILASDFTYAAKIYSMLIISERFLPSQLKTIKPMDNELGGVAGGSKYIVHGILFKFALDEHNMYNGDENAMKAAGHELRGLMCYYNCHIPELHLPLMCLVDYRGFRLVAMSHLPISRKTLIYGSSNAGKTVYNLDPVFASLMERAASIINLKGHVVDAKQTIIHGPVDIEGHKCVHPDTKAVQYYLVDFARTLPPAYPLSHHRNDGINHFLFEMLRPELVQSNSEPDENGRLRRVPLNSDAFSFFLKYDPCRKESKNEIQRCFRRLTKNIFPMLVNTLHALYQKNPKELHLPEQFHIHGVNMRYLGMIRKLCFGTYGTEGLRQMLLDEMVARIMKIHIKSAFRTRTQEEKIPAEEPYRQEILDNLNRMFLLGPYRDEYWCKKIKEAIRVKYTHKALIPKEKKEEASLLTLIDVARVMERWQDMTGITLNGRAPLVLLKAGCLKLVSTDIEVIHEKIKVLHVMSEAMATQFSLSINKVKGSECIRLYELAEQKFQESTCQNPTNFTAHLRWGQMLLLCSKRKEFLHHHKYRKVQVESVWKLRKALEIHSSLLPAHRDYAMAVVENISTASIDPEDRLDATDILLDCGTHLQQALDESGPAALKEFDTEIVNCFREVKSRAILSFFAMELTGRPKEILHARLYTLTKLHLLNFRHFRIETLLKIARVTPQLAELIVGHTEIRDREMKQMTQHWQSLVKIKLVSITVLSHIPNLPRLQKLSFVDCPQIKERVYHGEKHSRLAIALSFKSCPLVSITPFFKFLPRIRYNSRIKSLKLYTDSERKNKNVEYYIVQSGLGGHQSRRALPALPNLTTLELGGLLLEEIELTDLFKYSSNIQSLKILDCQNITDVTFSAISKHLPNLTSLTSSNHAIPERSLKALESLPLRYLNLNSSQGAEVGFFSLLDSIYTLEELHVSNWTFKSRKPTKSTLPPLEIEFSPWINSLVPNHMHQLSTVPPAIHILDTDGKNSEVELVCSSCWVIIHRGFSWACSECEFRLCENCYGGESNKKEAAANRKSSNKTKWKKGHSSTGIKLLLKLDLGGWSPPTRVITAICYHCKLLNTLILENSPDLEQECLGAIGTLEHLTELNLSNCPRLVGQYIGATVSQLTNLRKLNIAECKSVTDQTLSDIASCSELEELDLSGCIPYTFIGLQELLLKAKHLRILKLGQLSKDTLSSEQIMGLRHTLDDIDISFTESEHPNTMGSLGVKDILEAI